MVTPRPIHRHTGLPISANTVHRYLLFWSAKVTGGLTICETTHSRSASINTVIDDHVWLQGSTIVVEVLTTLMVPSVLPLTIKPHHSRLILGNDLLQLGLHVSHVSLKISSGSWPLIPSLARQEVRMMPIQNRMISTELNPLSTTLFREFFQRITLKLRVPNMPSALLTRPNGKPLMVFACDDNIFHARSFRRTNNLLSIEIDRIKLLLQGLPISRSYPS